MRRSPALAQVTWLPQQRLSREARSSHRPYSQIDLSIAKSRPEPPLEPLKVAAHDLLLEVGLVDDVTAAGVDLHLDDLPLVLERLVELGRLGDRDTAVVLAVLDEE